MKTVRLFITILASAAITAGWASAEPAKEVTHGTHGTYEAHMAKPVSTPVELARPKIEIMKLPVAGHTVAPRPAIPTRNASAPNLGEVNAAAKHPTATLDGAAMKRKP